MSSTEFFKDQTEQSRTKARIVAKYFDGWSNVIAKAARERGVAIQYIDLFAGRGRYDDGSESTPLLILRSAIAKPKLRDMFVSVFNDADPDNADALRTAIDTLPDIGLLKHRPKVYHDPVDEQVTALFEGKRLVPTLTFIDPFGYKGLSMRLIQATLKDWGCDCVFFFNFNRVNAAIHNTSVEEHVTALFDAAEAAPLRQRLQGMRPHEREARVVEELTAAIRRKHGKHVLHFRFLNEAATRTSHHLVFATKHPLGCKIMKDIMAKESSWSESGGLPSFACSPRPVQRNLFDAPVDPLAELEAMVLEQFAGQRLTVGEIYEQHGLSQRFMLWHYKDVLKRLEMNGRVVATPPACERREGTMADRVLIQFPPRAG